MNRFDEEKKEAQRRWRLRKRERLYHGIEAYPELQYYLERAWDRMDREDQSKSAN